MTKIEILDEILNLIIKQGERAVEPEGGCFYSTDPINPEEGCRCGIGLAIDPEKAPRWVWNFNNTADFLDEKLGDEGDLSLDDILYDRFKGHSVEFWTGVQKLHDNGRLWNSNGPGLKLSSLGKNFLAKLKTRYQNDKGQN
jgi:hypothetical protein